MKTGPVSGGQAITVLQCQPITRCTMAAMAPHTNGELRDSLDLARAAWASCAAKVDMIVDCQARGLAGGERYD
jgi:hypothetical protein